MTTQRIKCVLSYRTRGFIYVSKKMIACSFRSLKGWHQKFYTFTFWSTIYYSSNSYFIQRSTSPNWRKLSSLLTGQIIIKSQGCSDGNRENNKKWGNNFVVDKRSWIRIYFNFGIRCKKRNLSEVYYFYRYYSIIIHHQQQMKIIRMWIHLPTKTEFCIMTTFYWPHFFIVHVNSFFTFF